MKLILITVLAILTTGCSTMPSSLKSGFDGRDYWPDRVQYNANTRDSGPVLINSGRTPGSVNLTPSRGTFTPSTIQTNAGPVLIVPNYSTGQIQSIIGPR